MSTALPSPPWTPTAEDKARAEAEWRRVIARDWKDVPRGFYAIALYDLADWMDRDCEGEPDQLLGYVLYHRKVPQQFKNGGSRGSDKFVTSTAVMVPGTDRETFRNEVRWFRELHQQPAGAALVSRELRSTPVGHVKVIADMILCDLEAGRNTYREDYGKFFGKCGCCGRTLTDPVSKLVGIGPECRGWRTLK